MRTESDIRRMRPWLVGLAVIAGLAAVVALVNVASVGEPGEEGEPGEQGQQGEPRESWFADLLDNDREVTLPAGTVLVATLQQGVSTNGSQEGQPVSARVAQPVTVDGETVVPAGTVLHGEVVQADRTPRIGGRARLGLAFTRLELPSGEDAAMNASFEAVGKSQVKKDAATIGGATVGGAILGRVIGHQSGEDADGTAVGAVVGGAIGSGVALSNRGQDVALGAGATIRVALDGPVTVEVES